MAQRSRSQIKCITIIFVSALCAIIEQGTCFQTASVPKANRARNKLPYHENLSLLHSLHRRERLPTMTEVTASDLLSARSLQLQPIQADSKKFHSRRETRKIFFFQAMKKLFKKLLWGKMRRTILSFALATILATSLAPPLALATTYGRAGGSFGGSSTRSSRSSSTSSRIGGSSRGTSSGSSHHHHHFYRPSRPYYSPSSPSLSPSIHIYRAAPRSPPIVVLGQPTAVTVPVPVPRQSLDRPPRSRGFSVGDVVLLTTTSGLIVYGFRNNFRRRRDREDDDDYTRQLSPLGPGATFTSVTVSIDVPDRDDPNCILQRLRRLAERTDTSTRKNVQNLVSEGRSTT